VLERLKGQPGRGTEDPGPVPRARKAERLEPPLDVGDRLSGRALGQGQPVAAVYRYCRDFLEQLALGLAPTSRAWARRSLTGSGRMLITSYLRVTSRLSSMFSFPIWSFHRRSSAISSEDRGDHLHGPHHSAQEGPTSTGTSDA